MSTPMHDPARGISGPGTNKTSFKAEIPSGPEIASLAEVPAPERAVARAVKQIESWAGGVVHTGPEYAEPNAEFVSDILSDLRHFCDASGIDFDFDGAVHSGDFVFHDEKRDPQPEVVEEVVPTPQDDSEADETLPAPVRAVARAVKQISAWSRANVEADADSAEPNAEHVADVISDLKHFSEANGVDFDGTLKSSNWMYNDEISDPT